LFTKELLAFRLPIGRFAPMIVVHHLNNSRSQRVLWLLEELGLDYEVRPYQREGSGGSAPMSLRAVHPLGKAPVIEDGPAVLAESGAIIEYLLLRYGGGRLVPEAGTEAHTRYHYWLHYAEGSAMPNLLLKLIFDQIETGPVPFFVRPVVRGLARAVKGSLVDPAVTLHLDYMESELASRPWFAGEEFTAADIQMGFPIQAAVAKAGLDETRPALMGFVRRIVARPAWQRSVARGGPYDLSA
jgi:glutathione S-transferase